MTKVNWHPYPKEKPKKSGEYLVTLICNRKNDEPTVTTFQYSARKEKWVPIWCNDVIAWAEKPEPYKPEEPEDNHPDAITARKYAEGDPETVKALHIFDE